MMPYTVRPLDPWIGKYTPGRRASHHGPAQHRPGPTHQREREMSLWYELDDDGSTRPLPAGQYPKRDHKRVAEATVNSMWISTVFLGLDHSYLSGPPILFETMVFPSKGDYGDLLCWRYRTKAAAEAGHSFLVAALEAGTPIDEIEQP